MDELRELQARELRVAKEWFELISNRNFAHLRSWVENQITALELKRRQMRSVWSLDNSVGLAVVEAKIEEWEKLLTKFQSVIFEKRRLEKTLAVQKEK